MTRVARLVGWAVFTAGLVLPAIGPAGMRAVEPAVGDWRRLVAEGKLVEIARLDPSLAVELRYATARNGAGRALYPREFPALLRPGVARKLLDVQRRLHASGLGLKVWDAYRPAAAQRALWRQVGQSRYVADPDAAGPGSMHARGAAVDVTLVDLATGRERLMPTDFDQFSSEAAGLYRGPDAAVGANLRRLHRAMVEAGFLAQYQEWWHFTDRDWRQYDPMD